MLRRYYGKISKLPINEFFGHDGELVVDDITGKVYVMDGITLGGTELVGATPKFGSIPPDNPTPGALWYDPESGRTYIYYQSQWVDAAPNTTYVLPHASASTLGGIKVGLGLAIDNEGLVTANSHTPNELINGEYVLNLSSDGWVRFPEINSTGAAVAPIDDGISLGTDTGNVSIWPGPDNKWTFGTDGKLTLPVAGKIANGNNEWTFGLDGWLRFPEINATGAAVAPVDDGISLGTDTGNVSIWPGESRWRFNTNGNLTLPASGSINFSNSYSILTGLATESFVTGQGFITSSALTGLASESFVTGQGYLTSVPTASNIQLGGVKVDNVSIVIDGSGTISSVGTTSVVPLTSTAPVSPNNGELWYDTNSGKIYVYIDDVWVDTTFPVSRDLSGIGSIGQTFLSRGSIKQLSVPNDAGKIITISTDVGVLRLPQITSVMLGATFEFYFDVDAGQIHIQSYYTGVRETTDVFRGSIFVGVDNATTGKLHKATATTSTACDLFLGQHHAKAGSYIKVKAIEFNSVGTWMFQGTCIGDTGQTPNSSDHPFQDYN